MIKQDHALRTICSVFNIVVSSLVVVLYFLLIEKMTFSIIGAAAVSTILAFGTLLWPYSGTFFSEPLTLLFVLISFYFLIRNDSHFISDNKSAVRVFIAGMSLGIAFTVHISAILLFPFLLIYAIYPYFEGSTSYRKCLKPAVFFIAGYSIFIALQMSYNYLRFGDIFEEGRRAQYVYSHFIFPYRSLFGILFSSGKGICFYCPVILLGILFWSSFFRKHRFLALLVLSIIVTRILFISCRSDWHGGFCLGPRQLLMIVPFLLIPVGYWFAEQKMFGGKLLSITIVCIFILICMFQQIYFCIGEIFAYIFIKKLTLSFQGITAFTKDWGWFSWKISPLFGLLELDMRAPFLLHDILMSNYELFASCCLAHFFAMAMLVLSLLKPK